MTMQTCAETKWCPISKGSCPGVCIYADIFENIDMGIIVYDLVKKAPEFYNSVASDLLEPDTDLEDFEAVQELLLANLKDEYNLWRTGESQTIQYKGLILGYSVYPLPGDQFIWIFLRDITDKTRLESIGNAANTMDNLGYVFSGIRHEIGNPINSAKMALSVLKENITDFSREEILEYVDRSLDGLQRVEFLLKVLRNINMFEKPIVENIELSAFLEKFIRLVRDDFSRKGVSISSGYPSDDIWVNADPRSLQQVMLNVFTNAVNAMDGCAQPNIDVSVSSNKGFAWIKVTDNGCGIDARDLNNIFKPFFTTKPQGTGLGLVICQKILAEMNCTIEIESSKNIGTSVSISLPEGQSDTFISE
jgi:signal transduction histidine kinase